MRLRVLASMQAVEPALLETPGDETPSGLARQTRQPPVIHDLAREIRYRRIMRCWRSMACAPAAHCRYRATPPGSHVRG